MRDVVSTISERIQIALQIRGLKQTDLVEMTGIGKSSISTYISGEYEPKQRNIYKIAKALNVSEAWLMGYDVDMVRIENGILPPKATTGVMIPVLGRVAAGVPTEAIEEIVDWEEITKDMAANGDHFGLLVKGDSMEPRILEGDVVIVKKQADADTGDLVVAIVNGEDATLKRLKKNADGIILIPNNHEYEPMFYNWADIDKLPVKIIGKVVELRGKF